MEDKLAVGVVRGSHGLTGELKVMSLSGFTEHFLSMDTVDLVFKGQRRKFKVQSVRAAYSSLVYMQLEGIETNEEAQKYNRWTVEVRREKAHALSSGEWYVADLEGCTLWYKQDGLSLEECAVAKVVRVFEGGAGFLVEAEMLTSCTFLDDEMKLDKRGKPRMVYVPFKDAFIGDVDVERKSMELLNLWILE